MSEVFGELLVQLGALGGNVLFVSEADKCAAGVGAQVEGVVFLMRKSAGDQEDAELVGAH